MSCSFVRLGVPLGCFSARRSFLFSWRRNNRPSMFSGVYSKPFSAVSAPRFCIPFVFHTISLQEALVPLVFCFQHTDLPSGLYLRLTIVLPFP